MAAVVVAAGHVRELAMTNETKLLALRNEIQGMIEIRKEEVDSTYLLNSM